LETKRGVFEIAEGIGTGPREGATRFLCPLGNLDPSELPRAGQAGQWPSISTVRFDPITRLCGEQRGGDDPAIVPFFGPRALEPGATGASFIDEDEGVGLRLQRTKELLTITLAGANAAEVGALSAVLVSHVGHGHRLLVDVHADEECARLRPR
jgi:hypothetical protein